VTGERERERARERERESDTIRQMNGWNIELMRKDNEKKYSLCRVEKKKVIQHQCKDIKFDFNKGSNIG
jgi:hypothetical protein